MDITTKYALITSGLKEIIADEVIIKKIMAVRPLKIYWGTAPTGSIHIGYLLPLLKIVDFTKANCDVTILLADLHAFLDNKKTPLKQLDNRTLYYKELIKIILSTLGANMSKIKFVKGTDFQLSREYTMDMYKLNSLTTLRTATHAGAEVVKQSNNPNMTGLIYPTLQVLDEQYLNTDVQFGGVDQRKIFMFAREMLPKIGYKKRMHFMSDMIPALSKTATTITTHLQPSSPSSLVLNIDILDSKEQSIKKITKTFSQPHTTHDNALLNLLEKSLNTQLTHNTQPIQKMSASSTSLKIDILDTKKQIKKKINQTFCEPQNTTDNTLLILLDKLLFPLLRNQPFIINRPEQYGGNIKFNNIQQVTKAIDTNELHPSDFKHGVASLLTAILTPIKNEFTRNKLDKLYRQAYK